MTILTDPQTEQPQFPVDPYVPIPDHARVVAIGASAGGLHAVSLILAALPLDFPAPILVVQHLSPDFPSRLARILGRHTPLHVKQAEQGDRLRAGWVYVAPPGRHLLACADGSLTLTLTPKVHHCRPSADVLLTSVAAVYGVQAVGAVLTGGDGDGAAGIQAIKAAGGVTIAQDLPTSQQPSMPRNAAATGDVDYVLPLPDIAAALVALTSPGRHFDREEKGRFQGQTLIWENANQAGRSDRDKVTERVRARRDHVMGLLAQARTTPTAPGLLEEAVAELAACSEALGVAEEALRVQSDVITSYWLSLKAEAAEKFG